MSEQNEVVKVEPVVSGDTKVKKKNWLERTGEAVFSQRDAGTVGSYLFLDILVPALKKTIFDLITNAADLFLYGGNTPSMNRRANGGSNTYVSYSSPYASKPAQAAPKTNTVSGTNIFTFDKITFASKADAVAVLDQMYELLERYQIVTVSQFYDLSNCITDNAQATKFGWMNLTGAEVVRDAFGGDYYIKFPKPYPID